MKMALRGSVLFMVLGLGVTACSSGAEQESSAATCEDVAAHVSACFPDDAAQISTTCDVAQAESVLATSCEDLQRQSAQSKADGSCNPLFFWRYCHEQMRLSVVSGCDEGGCDWSLLPGEIDYFHSVDPSICYDYEIRNERGESVARGEASGSLVPIAPDLPNGDYRIVVKRRDGTDAKLLVDESNLRTFDFGYGVESYDKLLPTFSVKNGTYSKDDIDMVFSPDEKEAFRRCGQLDLKVQLMCDGSIQQNFEGQFDWYASLEVDTMPGELFLKENEEHPNYVLRAPAEWEMEEVLEEINTTRDLDLWRKDVKVWGVTPGTYTFTFHRVRLPMNVVDAIRDEPYDYWGNKRVDAMTNPEYATGETFEHVVTLGVEDFKGDLGIKEVMLDLDYGATCR